MDDDSLTGRIEERVDYMINHPEIFGFALSELARETRHIFIRVTQEAVEATQVYAPFLSPLAYQTLLATEINERLEADPEVSKLSALINEGR